MTYLHADSQLPPAQPRAVNNDECALPIPPELRITRTQVIAGVLIVLAAIVASDVWPWGWA